MGDNFRKLLSPIQIGPMTVRNRIVMPAMNTNYATTDGEVTAQLVEFYRARARGGVGLITLGFSYGHPLGRVVPRMIASHDDRAIPGLRSFADAMHAEGAKVSLQVCHGGRRGSSKVSGAQTVAASPIPPLGGEVPREITRQEIAEVVESFARAAARARQAGFDGVELHMAHGFLLSGFLSPHSNKRTDEYGGSLENRARFPLAVLRRVKEEIGKELAVTIKMNGSDFVEGGITLDEAKETARIFEQGGVDAITVSAATDSTLYMSIQPAVFPRGCLVPLAQGVKSVVAVPVVAVGRINDPQFAEAILAEGKADLVAMGRSLICDPELPRKVAEGRPEDIRPCVACSTACTEGGQRGGVMSCISNGQAGREEIAKIVPTKHKRRVLVAGGGPAGMEAARVAAIRGHKVTLCEKSARLGGLLNAGSVPPHKYELPNLVRYFTRQLEKLGVEVRTGREVDVKTLEELAPDVVVVATGGQATVLPTNAQRVFTVSAADALTGEATLGHRVAVVGASSTGCETAEYLAEKGHAVTVLEMLDDYATDLRPEIKRLLGERLNKLGVEMLLGCKVTAVRQGEVAYERAGQQGKVEGLDNVVFAMGYKPDLSLFETAKARGLEAHAVGDCTKPGNIFDAVHRAFDVALTI
jgi:2,4-dienoyl-CoA reductase-like NADH-dependent reductase (Old Yellow Enzyme family)/thioredoxin reductase